MKPLFYALAAALAATAAPAHATPLVAFGITYTLTESTTGNPLTDQFVLGISGINGASDTEGGRASVEAFAFTPPSNFLSASVIAPSGYTFLNGGLSANGCNGNGGFFCFQDTSAPSSPALPANSTLSFTFDVTLSSGTFAGYDPSFKINWDGSKNNYDLVSKTLTPTISTPAPEPMSLSLLGMGLIGLTYARRRSA
jgi:hypothetical protein